jgi:hypothetical protein
MKIERSLLENPPTPDIMHQEQEDYMDERYPLRGRAANDPPLSAAAVLCSLLARIFRSVFGF